MVRYLIVLFLFLLTNFAFSQVRTETLTQTHTDAEIGLDRKAWQGFGNVSLHSDGYANDFTLPVSTNPCEKITNVNVNVNVNIQIISYNKTSGCPHYDTWFNLFYGCTTYTAGATCLPLPNAILEQPYPPNTSGATFNFNTSDPKYKNLDFGGNLSVDIIPVSDPGCNLVTSGGLTYQYTTTVTVTIAEDLPTTQAFTQVAPICSGGSLSSLPTTSNDGISGTWSPAINNLATTTYTFTPAVGQCANNATMTITVNPKITPTFTQVAAVCSGTTIAALPTIANGISGTWSPALNNLATTTYTFTPAVGQCANNATMTITVNPKITPTFTQVAAICSGDTLFTLPLSSSNSITGTWLPVFDNTKTETYTFTPTDVVCNNVATMTITVNPKTTPAFTEVSPICSGKTIADLPITSNNGISGTWTPSETIDTSVVGTLPYTFIPDAGQCAIPPTAINITVNPSNTLTSVSYTVTDAFENNQIITVFATATGNYLYQLDSGPSQTSPIFENVSSGIHTITVSDVNGCSDSISVNDILVIKHPKFFTPNGDGYNDVWNITSLNNQLNTRIYIFDRYGKLLKDISPNDAGWDGTFIGLQMPAGDYWFTVDYLYHLDIFNSLI